MPIQCPTLVVGGADSPLPQTELQAMAACLVCRTLCRSWREPVTAFTSTGPTPWRAVLEGFLEEQDIAVRSPGAA